MKPVWNTLPLRCRLFLLGAASPADRQPTSLRSITSTTNPGAGPIPIDSLYYTRATGSPAWSPDGKSIAFTTDVTGVPNLWKVPSTGGWPLQLSASNDREYDAVWSPDGRWIVYQSDHGGNEMWDIYAIPAAGGKSINLTNTPKVSETSPLWSPNGSELLISRERRNSPVSNIAILDWKTRKVRLITHEKAPDYIWSGALWSPGGHYVYASRVTVAFTNANVYRIDAATGKMRKLTRHRGNVLELLSSISPDGKTLLITSNALNGSDNVALMNATSGRLRWVTHTGWQAEAGDFSPDGRYFTYTVNADGQLASYLVERDSMQTSKLDFPAGLVFPAGDPSAFSPGGKRLLVSFENSQRPPDLWVYDIASHHARQLTYSFIASLKPTDIPRARLVHYRSFDGTMISAYLWVPFNLKRNGKQPGVVLPPGGPTGQMTANFNPLAAALASRGYVCIAPNVRGSTGYGKEFQKANHQDLGGGDLKDEVYAARFLINTGYVDPRRIGITGGSYGGYMTLMAIGKTPSVWAAAVERYGIINWLTMLKHETPFLRQYEESLLGNPVKDRKIYIADSPITYIKHAKAPLLVLQGENDVRVPREEAEQVVHIMKKNGQTVAAHFYPHEGHGFVRRKDRIDAIRRTLAWFDKYLKGPRKPR